MVPSPASVAVRLAGLTGRSVAGWILTAAAMDAYDTFDAPDVVRPQPFAGATLTDGVVGVTLPPKSVVMLDLR